MSTMAVGYRETLHWALLFLLQTLSDTWCLFEALKKGKNNGGEVKLPHPPRLGLKSLSNYIHMYFFCSYLVPHDPSGVFYVRITLKL